MRAHLAHLGWAVIAFVAGVASCSHDWDRFAPLAGGGAGGGGGAGSGTGGGPGPGGATSSSSSSRSASSSSSVASSNASSGVGGSGGGSGGSGSGGGPIVSASCKDLLAAAPATPSGVATIDPDGPGGKAPFDVYCEMVADGGGWTLALKVNGNASTFGYDAALWTNDVVLNAGSTALDQNEAKLASFSSVPFQAVRVGLVDGAPRWLVIPANATSLQSLFAGSPTTTSAGVGPWRGLVSAPSLQPHCNREGFNTQCTVGGAARARIGILGNDQDDCTSCDSWIGVGGDGACGQAQVGAGNVACYGADNGDKNTRTFAYLMVR